MTIPPIATNVAGQLLKLVNWRKVGRWVAARDLPPASGDQYNVLVLDFEHDEHGRQTRHVARSLGDAEGVNVYRVTTTLRLRESGSANENLSEAHASALDLCDRYNCQMAVWGEVIKDDSVLRINLSSPMKVGLPGRDYSLDATLRLPADFNADIGSVLYCECVSRLLSNLDREGRHVVPQLQEELKRARKLLDNQSVLNADLKSAIASAYLTSSLALFERTNELEWLSEAMNFVENETARPLGWAPKPGDIGFHAKLWLVAAEYMPDMRMIATAEMWLARAREARGLPAHLGMFFHAQCFRLASRLARTPERQQELVTREIAIYDALDQMTDHDGIKNDLQHLRLGARREVAVRERNDDELLQIVSEHRQLQPPLGDYAWSNYLGSCVELFVLQSNEAELRELLSRIKELSLRPYFAQSVMQRDLIKINEYRCRIKICEISELADIEKSLDIFEKSAILPSAYAQLAVAELHIKRAISLTDDLAKLKELLRGQVSAEAGLRVMGFFGYHVLQDQARRLQELAERYKPRVGSQAQ